MERDWVRAEKIKARLWFGRDAEMKKKDIAWFWKSSLHLYHQSSLVRGVEKCATLAVTSISGKETKLMVLDFLPSFFSPSCWLTSSWRFCRLWICDCAIQTHALLPRFCVYEYASAWVRMLNIVLQALNYPKSANATTLLFEALKLSSSFVLQAPIILVPNQGYFPNELKSHFRIWTATWRMKIVCKDRVISAIILDFEDSFWYDLMDQSTCIAAI